MATTHNANMAKTSKFLLIWSQLIMQMVMNAEAQVSSIIVFGDSSVDAGNNNDINTAVKSNFRPYGRDFIGGKPTGRFSNGRLPTDFISEAFGIKPAIPAYLDKHYNISDFATGVCFASAGTGLDPLTSNIVSVLPLEREIHYFKEYKKQLKEYLGNKKAEKILSDALYITSIGTNDFLENYYVRPKRVLEYSVDKYQDFLLNLTSEFVKTLYQLGGRKILLAGLPPMGCLPLIRTVNIFTWGSCKEEYNQVAIEYNKKLEGLVRLLSKEFKEIEVVLTDSYNILEDIIKNPRNYDFEVAERACCGTGKFEVSYMCNQMTPTCYDTNKYVFWDAMHLTEKTNRILANNTFKTSLANFQNKKTNNIFRRM
ncbi:hypothetical protein Leryth_014930 [Lithospermum erythrorhizon]|nr:hypothetical protein Leryth_014930 [Lithospermum erythrorhizon]